MINSRVPCLAIRTLVPVDGSPTSLIAVNHAASLAKAFSSKVTLVYALTIDPFISV
ncbi:universal stress protein, partial [Acinetobacter baumannii]|nr:universal stress protein [Acinetobacter baumannii]